MVIIIIELLLKKEEIQSKMSLVLERSLLLVEFLWISWSFIPKVDHALSCFFYLLNSVEIQYFKITNELFKVFLLYSSKISSYTQQKWSNDW